MLYKRRSLFTIVVASVVIGIITLSISRIMADNNELFSGAVNASELGHKVSVIGKLGLPIGTAVTLRGKWHLTKSEIDKWQSGYYEVTEMNGKQIDSHVIFTGLCKEVDNDDFTPWDGDLWEIRGYESGGIFGIPDKALVEIGALSWPSEKHGYKSYFCYYKASRVTKLNAKQGISPNSVKTASEQEPNSSRNIKASELLNQVSVIGRLNRPMGTIVTIRGKVQKPGDKYGSAFRVTHIDGIKNADPVDYMFLCWPSAIGGLKALGSVDITDGDVWELRGFEIGYWEGLPADVERERGMTTNDFPMEGFPFNAKFCYFKARRFRESVSGPKTMSDEK
jgi:hypothetical protein